MSRTAWTSPYAAPTHLPTANTHPRVLVAKDDLSRVRMNLFCPEHRDVWDKLLSRAAEPLSDTPEYDPRRLSILRAKAFVSLLAEDEALGKAAVDGILRELKNVSISQDMPDNCRAYGAVMFTAACVYDWCHALTDANWREEIVTLTETLLAPHFEVGFPPAGQGNLVSHGCEAQVLRDWLSFGIAAYDEYPDIYLFVEGRVEEHIVPLHNFYYRSYSHWQGSSYGPYRCQFDLVAEILVRTATGEKLFSDDLHEAGLTFLQFIRPDQEAFRIGDDANDYKSPTYDLHMYVSMAGLSGSLYRDPILRGFFLSHRPSYDSGEFFYSPELFLVTDDPAIGTAPITALPAIRYCPSPLGATFAHTGRDIDAAAVYMKIGEAYTANHEQRDAGDFMIYWKGSLASASNCYEYTSRDGLSSRYGSLLDFGYNKQTIAHNCVLVYDPDEVGAWSKLLNSGGQCIDLETARESGNFAEWRAKRCFTRAKVLAHTEALRADGSPDYCLLSGDLTRSYSEKINAYTRTMLAVFTGDAARPLRFFVYDRVSAAKAEFKKTWLLHCTEEPTVGDRILLRGKAGGKAAVTTLLPEKTDVTVIGGVDRKFVVNGENLSPDEDKKRSPAREDGWGRIEICPTDASAATVFLHVLELSDGGDASARLCYGNGCFCAVAGDTAVLFPSGDAYPDTVGVTLPEGAYRVFLTMADGTWSDSKTTYTTGDGKVAVLDGVSGTLTLKKIKD